MDVYKSSDYPQLGYETFHHQVVTQAKNMKILCSIIILVALLSSTLAKPGVYEENSDGEKAYKSALLKYLLRQFNGNNVLLD